MRHWGIFILSTLVPFASAGATEPELPATVRLAPPEKAISISVAPPAWAPTVYISGTVADPADSRAALGSVERSGDTEAQTRSVLNKIAAALADHGMNLSDIVMMRVFLVAPPGQQRMDFAGMTRAYLERFGTLAQPNKPARTTVQVAGLAEPGLLVEIEATASKGGNR
jgi:enamine deaminase RidA (YjgF/YER057c/UK114 family)